MSLVQLNVKEAKDLLRYAIKNNQYLQSVGKKPISYSLVGGHGIGKTSLCKQVAAEAGLEPIFLSLSQLDELGDLLGVPLRQFQLCKNVERTVNIGGVPTKKQVQECLWIDDPAVNSYLQKGYSFTGQKRMMYAEPEWIAGKTNPLCVILDDKTRAQPRFQQAIMELIQNQEYMSWKLPPGSTIVTTENPDDGKYFVEATDAAQKDRSLYFEIKMDVECWAEWAEKDGIIGLGINFALMHPELFGEKVSPRSMTNFFNAIASIKDLEKELPLVQIMAEGTIGPEAATMFTMFVNNKLHSLISPEKILLGDNEEHVIQEFNRLVDLKGSYRADIASVLNTRLINYALLYAEKNKIEQVTIDRLIRLCTVEDCLTDDLKYILVKKLIAGNKVKWQRLLNNSKVISMSMK